jgi:hypothetical protein
VATRILSFRNDTTNDVAIGDDPDGLVRTVQDRNLPAIVLHHEIGDLIKRSAWQAAGWIRRHYVASELGHNIPPPDDLMSTSPILNSLQSTVRRPPPPHLKHCASVMTVFIVHQLQTINVDEQ